MHNDAAAKKKVSIIAKRHKCRMRIHTNDAVVVVTPTVTSDFSFARDEIPQVHGQKLTYNRLGGGVHFSRN